MDLHELIHEYMRLRDRDGAQGANGWLHGVLSDNRLFVAIVAVSFTHPIGCRYYIGDLHSIIHAYLRIRTKEGEKKARAWLRLRVGDGVKYSHIIAVASKHPSRWVG